MVGVVYAIIDIILVVYIIPKMKKINIVVDTNVWVSGLWSTRGASHLLLTHINHECLCVHVSVPLMLEYEDVLKRMRRNLGMSLQDIDDVLDYVCKVSVPIEIFYLWRPFLKDPKDDLVLEAGLSSGSKFIVTYNERDFVGVEKLGISVISPKLLLKKIGVIK